MVTGRALSWVWVLVTAVGCSSVDVTPPGSDAAPKQVGEEKAWEGAGSEVGAGSSGGGSKGSTDVTPPGSSSSSAGSAAVGAPPDTSEKSYPGRGFVVHEWGTDTIVVGSDGSLQRGLHHEEEDLPAFVYDRIKAANLPGRALESVTIKMETPITYFYSDAPLQAKVRVDFPKGVLTQWYPGVSLFLPPLADANAVGPSAPATLADPVLDLTFPFASDQCRQKFSALTGGVLDWGTVDVLARDTDVTSRVPLAPLSDFSWSHARAVSSNPLARGGETEQFLFYRGLGDFTLPVGVTTETGGRVTLKNAYSEAIGAVFFIHVDAEGGAFAAHPQGIPAGGTLADGIPELDAAEPLDIYTEALSEAVTASLDATGLYHDEALAMVNTWKRQWFRTPGARLLYAIPQSWTESSIPLTISPKPDEVVRIMLIRVELITPEQEQADVQAIQRFDSSPAEAELHFAELGRFAEPRLRRALALAPNVAGDAYLSQLERSGGSVAGD